MDKVWCGTPVAAPFTDLYTLSVAVLLRHSVFQLAFHFPERMLFISRFFDSAAAPFCCCTSAELRWSDLSGYFVGAYFARDAKYSNRYAAQVGETKQMFVARVLVGSFAKGDSKMRAPPARDASTPYLLHDSTVDSESNPSIFVTYNDAQAMPAYLITYTE